MAAFTFFLFFLFFLYFPFFFFFFRASPLFFETKQHEKAEPLFSIPDRPSCHVTFSSLTKCRWMDGIRGAGSSFRRDKCPSVSCRNLPPSSFPSVSLGDESHYAHPKPSPTHTRTYALFTLLTPTKPPTQQPPPIATLPHWPALSPKPNRLICDAALAARYRQPLQSLSFIPI